MHFYELVQPFNEGTGKNKGLIGITSQSKIVEFFLLQSVNEESNLYISNSESTLRSWFTGARPIPTDIWSDIHKDFDEVRLTNSIARKLNDKKIDSISSSLGINLSGNDSPDKYYLAAAIAMQIKNFAENNGESESILDLIYHNYSVPTEFNDYIEKSKRKYSKLKTLLYSTEERSFDEFYVCNNIRTSRHRFWTRGSAEGKDNNVIKNATLELINNKAPYSLLIGMGGIGKSMMMRHLFLDSINKYRSNMKFPILVTLREFGVDKSELIELIADSVQRFDPSFSLPYLHKYLNEGKCQLLFDGLDEIKANDLESFERQLEHLLDCYPNNQVVMSTRRFSRFIRYSRFKLLWIEEFTNEQSIELINKLDFCPEEPKLKEHFIEKLENEYFKNQSAFVSNPLLLTLMLMSYRRFANIPEQKYLFYEEAYQTLLRRHDHDDKVSYRRIFHSVNEPAEFTNVFREFCARSYRNADYEFDDKKFEEYFSQLNAKTHVTDLTAMTAENFLFDILNSTCIMYEESQGYHFLHRSFQEYLFADYYSRADDESLKRLEKFLRKNNSALFDDSIAYDLLYDLAPEKVEKFIFIPFLEYLLDGDNDDTAYWSFLKKGYSYFGYSIYDNDLMNKYLKTTDKEAGSPANNNDVELVVLSQILKLLKIPSEYSFEVSKEIGDYKELICGYWFADIVARKENNESDIIFMDFPKKIFEEKELENGRFFKDRFIRDNDNKIIPFGYEYRFDFSLPIDNPTQYSSLKELFLKETCPTRQTFNSLKKYLNELKTKYENSPQDDDF